MAQQSPRVAAKIFWAALVGGATVFLGVAVFVVFQLRGGAGLGAPRVDPGLSIGGSLALSMISVAVSWLWAVRMRIAPSAQGGVVTGSASVFPPGPEADAYTRLTIACALCEGSALLAVVVFLLTGNVLALAPYALSWIGLAAHFPGDRHWAQLGGLRTGAVRNPMIRG